MNRALLALFGSVVTLTFAFPVTASAQAAAESALTNAFSSSATVKAGSTLGHALNQGSTHLGTRVQEQTSGPVRVGTPQKISRAGLGTRATGSLSGGSVHTGASAGPSTVSIQGGEGTCISGNPGSQASPAKASTGTASIDCHGQKPTPKPGTTEEKYKSFVTLSFPK
jgi:hypothetical protein